MRICRIAGMVAIGFMSHAQATDFTDTARVISVTPIYEQVAETRQECYPETASAPARLGGERSVAAPLIGGVAGALLGSRVGRGSGRDAATAVGAVVGTIAADRVANPNSEGSVAGAVVGGAAGAIAGNQVGSGSGRTAATGAGAVAGAVIGDRVATGATATAQRDPGQSVQRCRTVDAGRREIIRGYNVVYRYNGHEATTTMPYDPGNTVRVSVGVVDRIPPPEPSPNSSNYDRDYRPATRTQQPRAPEGGYTYR